MLRPKQIIIALVTCAVACFLLYTLYARENAGGAQSINSINGKVADSGHPAEQLPVAPSNYNAKKDNLQTIVLEPIKNKCKIYEELRNIDFQQSSLQDTLCSGVKAYKRGKDGGFPMCKLPNPFERRLQDIVEKSSATTDLLDMRNEKTKMYIYPEKDYVSKMIRKHHRWEPNLVHTTMRFAERVPNATFLDAGCNIGVYSVLAARLGLPVVSLDANIRNLLRLRLTLSAASLDASLVWNFIGSGDQLSYLNFPEDCNVGGATKFGRAVRDTIPVMPVRSDRLCSLISTKNIVIKLDVEGGEADFLRTSGRLFSDFNVAVVQMEWFQRHMVGNDSSTIINFFTSRHYSAWRTPGLSELDTKSVPSWGNGDLIWVHEKFKYLLPEVKEGKK